MKRGSPTVLDELPEETVTQIDQKPSVAQRDDGLLYVDVMT